MSTTCTAAWTTFFDFDISRQPVEPVVGDLGDADVRVLRRERVRRGEGAAAREGVVQRGLAGVGEADQPEAFHERPPGYRAAGAAAGALSRVLTSSADSTRARAGAFSG